MPNCNKCNKNITQEPFYSITNQKPYCSKNCLPDEAFDKLYSFEYMNLVSAFRYFNSEKYSIEILEDRVNLENEMDEIIEDYKSYYLGDSENSFYKSQIIRLYKNILTLYDEIHNILIDKESFEYYGITIYWDDLKRDVVKDKLQNIFNELTQGLKHSNIIFENLSYDAFNKNEIRLTNYKDVICVESEEEQNKVIRILMDIFQKYEPSLIYDDETFVDYIHFGKIKQCLVCLHWEDESDFSFDDGLNVEACSQWDSCRNFPN